MGNYFLSLFLCGKKKCGLSPHEQQVKEKGNYMTKKLKLPKFKNETDEQKFWNSFDLADVARPGDFIKLRMPNLRPSTTPVSIRLPDSMIMDLKVIANSMDIPYQSFIKMILSEKVTALRSSATYQKEKAR
jgi:predicted DNA binding CopG/RHH family protein